MSLRKESLNGSALDKDGTLTNYGQLRAIDSRFIDLAKKYLTHETFIPEQSQVVELMNWRKY